MLGTISIFNNHPAKSRGVSSDSAKIRRYSARLSRIIVLLFNKFIRNHSVKVFESFLRYFLQFFFASTYKTTYIVEYTLRTDDKYREEHDHIWRALHFVE